MVPFLCRHLFLKLYFRHISIIYTYYTLCPPSVWVLCLIVRVPQCLGKYVADYIANSADMATLASVPTPAQHWWVLLFVLIMISHKNPLSGLGGARRVIRFLWLKLWRWLSDVCGEIHNKIYWPNLNNNRTVDCCGLVKSLIFPW